jgi:hypothetical protein
MLLVNVTLSNQKVQNQVSSLEEGETTEVADKPVRPRVDAISRYYGAWLPYSSNREAEVYMLYDGYYSSGENGVVRYISDKNPDDGKANDGIVTVNYYYDKHTSGYDVYPRL